MGRATRERGRPARMLFRDGSAGQNRMGPYRAGLPAAPRERGVPPAACRSDSLGWGTRPPCRREPHGLGPGRVLGGGAPRERGRPARMHYRSVSLSFPAMGHPSTARMPARTWEEACPHARPKQSRWRPKLCRLCRSSRVEEMGEAVPGCVRAGRPRSRVGFIP